MFSVCCGIIRRLPVSYLEVCKKYRILYDFLFALHSILVYISAQIRDGGSVKAMIKMFLSVIIDRYLNKIIKMLMDAVGNEYGGGNLHGERGSPMLHSQSDAFFF